MDQVDIHAAAHVLIGRVDGTVVDARTPVRKITGTDGTCAERPFVRMLIQIVLRFHEHLAPPHGRRNVSLLTGVGDLLNGTVDLIPGDDGLFNEESAGPVLDLFQRFPVKGGGVGDERDVVVRQRVIVVQIQQLVAEQFLYAGAERNAQVVTEGVNVEFDPALLAEMVQVAQMPGPDGTEAEKQNGKRLGHFYYLTRGRSD